MAYGFPQFVAERMARAQSTSLPISTRHAVEVASFLRNRKLQRAKKMLDEVIAMERAVPFNRYDHGMGHKAGMGAGSYPVNASKAFLNLLESVEANAQAKGLSVSNLVIAHISASHAGGSRHGGRHGGRKMKRTHIEIVVSEANTPAQEQKAVSA